MRSSAAARRYARALFSLAREDDRIADIGSELDAMRELIGRMPELKDALFRPLHPVKQRSAALREVCVLAGLQDEQPVRNVANRPIAAPARVDLVRNPGRRVR